MKREYELILKAVLVNKTEKEYEDIDKLLEEKMNWGVIGGILINHRLGGYFFGGLNEMQKKKIPKEMREALKLLVKAQRDQQSKLITEMSIVNNELIKSKIRFAALKGVVFNSEMYDIGARRSNDLDFLVHEEDLDKLDDSLRKLGYIQSFVPNGRMVEASKKEKLIQRLNYHDLVPYVKKIGHDLVELDINFLFDNNQNLIDKKVFNMGTFCYNGRNYSVIGLNYHTNIAQLCTHFYREATNTIWTEGKRDVMLYKIVDILNYIRYYCKNFEEDKMINVFKELNISDKVYYTFSVISEFYNDSLIKVIMNKLRPNITDEFFINKIYDHKNKTTIVRTESFYKSAFDCIF